MRPVSSGQPAPKPQPSPGERHGSPENDRLASSSRSEPPAQQLARVPLQMAHARHAETISLADLAQPCAFAEPPRIPRTDGGPGFGVPASACPGSRKPLETWRFRRGSPATSCTAWRWMLAAAGLPDSAGSCDKSDCKEDVGPGHQQEGRFGWTGERGRIEASPSSVLPRDLAVDGRCAPAQRAHRRRQASLSQACENCESSGQRNGNVDATLRSSAHEYRKGSPRQREADVVVDDPPAPFEVVGRHEHHPDDDPRNEAPADDARADQSDDDRSRQCDHRQHDEHARRNTSAERSTVDLVEPVRGNTDREEEGSQARREADPVKGTAECRTDRDVAEVPRRVRRMEECRVVPPAAGRERVERWTLCRLITCDRLGSRGGRPKPIGRRWKLSASFGWRDHLANGSGSSTQPRASTDVRGR
jgi:hypothetical protein